MPSIDPNPINNSIPEWVADAIFYQIFPDRFCIGNIGSQIHKLAAWEDVPTRENFFGGNLQGIIDRLDYLQAELGVNALYLNPIFTAQTNHKYDTGDYFHIDPAFGSNDLFGKLVDQVHLRGMHIILDGVFNHCGLSFEPFKDLIRNGEKSEYRNWFLARSYPISTNPLNYLTCGGAEYLPKLNTNHRPVQEFILEVAQHWLKEYAIDGWRLDVPFKIPREFWREFRQAVKRINPQAYLVGEIWREASPWIQNGIFDGVTNYRLRELILDYCQTNILDGEDFVFETEMLALAHAEASHAMLNLLGSHDTARILTVLGGNYKRLKIALTYIMTVPGAPLVYYGDEIGMLGETDPDCRCTMIWDEKLWNNDVVDLYRGLIALRKAHQALRRGNRETLVFFNGVFAYRMSYQQDEVVVILNSREGIPDVSFVIPGKTGVWQDYWSGQTFSMEKQSIRIGDIPPLSTLILVHPDIS